MGGLKKQLDDLTRLLLFHKEGGRCWSCGGMATEVAHMFSRTYLNTRWDTEPDGNCHLMCRECHAGFHDTNGYEDEFIRRHGEEKFYEIVRRKNQKFNSMHCAMRELVKQMKEELWNLSSSAS